MADKVQSIREAFEAHWYDFYHAGSISARSDGRYFNATVNAAWDAWQVAFQAGRESAIREAVAAPGVAQGVAQGWVMVPVEPTPTMLAALWAYKANTLAEQYAALLAAASSPTAEQPTPPTSEPAR